MAEWMKDAVERAKSRLQSIPYEDMSPATRTLLGLPEPKSREWLEGFRAGLKAHVEMRQLTSIETLEVFGKGTVYVVEMPIDLWEPNNLVHTEALLDGNLVRINAVEAFARARSPQNPYHGNIGLTVTFL